MVLGAIWCSLEKTGIQRQFNRLYDPNHPVRNAIERLDSVEVVGTIRNALKKTIGSKR